MKSSSKLCVAPRGVTDGDGSVATVESSWAESFDRRG